MAHHWLAATAVFWLGCSPAACPPCEARSAASSSPCTVPLPTRTEPEVPHATGTGPKEARTQQVIADVVAQNRGKVRACYEAERAKSPELSGTLTVHFTLDPKGHVTEAHVVEARTTLKQPSLHRCSIEALKALSFPPSSRGFESQVNYPFDFKP